MSTNTEIVKSSDVQSPLKYQKPKILLIDMGEDVENALAIEGFNVTSGSFGRPYKVKKQDGYLPVIVNGTLPDYLLEKDIIVVDIEPDGYGEAEDERRSTPGDKDWWANSNQGEIDPRSRLMAFSRDKIDTVIAHGGICIVFASDRREQEIKWATQSDIHAICHGLYRIHNAHDLPFNNWSFLSIFESLSIDYARGEEIAISAEGLAGLLPSHLKGAYFNCTFQPSSSLAKRWVTIATDKFERPVCGAICPTSEDDKGGYIFIFPQLKGKATFLTKLIKDFLPNLSPHLFPDFEGAKWVHRPNYELPEIQNILDEIRQLEEESRERIEILRQQIEHERTEKDFLYELIRASGDALVQAVKKTLDMLGFKSVVDVDEELRNQGKDTLRDEDLQIHDSSPVLLVEVKGIGGTPHDEEALAVEKYIPTRMREWNRTDVNGLSIINYQRHLPGLERQKNPFRDKILENAKARQLGLLTTWDLYRLARGFLKNHWSSEQVKPLFYYNGRIEPLPIHYEFVGTVEGFLDKIQVVGVAVEQGSISLGDTIAFELPIDYEEQVIESLHVDDQPAKVAQAGATVGIKTHLSKQEAKEGVRVFRIVRDHLKALLSPVDTSEVSKAEPN